MKIRLPKESPLINEPFRRLLSICIVFILCLSLMTGCGTVPSAKNAELTPAELPDAGWQIDLTFPDWRSFINGNYSINNRTRFNAYHGQGELYLTCEEKSSAFSIYINGEKIDIPELAKGDSYVVDISGMTADGKNSLQVSDIAEGSVRVCIPYPTVMDGTLKEVGISEKAIDLIDKIISSDVEYGFPSAQLAIVKDGRLVYEKSWGNVQTYDEKGNSVESTPVTKDTLYDLASNTKMYSVNYALQYLVTNGEVTLDTKIVDILGDAFAEDTIQIEYEGAEPVSLKTNKKWKASLTLKDLLTHQGGFPGGPHYYNDRYDHASQDYDSDKGNVLYAGTAGDAATREETLKLIFKTPLLYKPGTQTMYSDVDYMVLCYCVEALTGQRIDDYLKEIFWEPMELDHITYNPLRHGFSPEDCAATELMGNTRDGNMTYTGIRTETIQGEVHDCNAYYCMDGVSGHAGLFASATDLAKLASVMLTGGYGDHRYFSQNVMDAFAGPKSVEDAYYGLGWWRDADHDYDRYFGSVTSSETIGHQGFTGTMTMIDRENNLVIVLLTNCIHSKILEGDETLSAWGGKYFLTSTLGFVSQIAEIGMEGEPSDALLKSLMADMTADAKRILDETGVTDENHPQMQAYKALLSVQEGM